MNDNEIKNAFVRVNAVAYPDQFDEKMLEAKKALESDVLMHARAGGLNVIPDGRGSLICIGNNLRAVVRMRHGLDRVGIYVDHARSGYHREYDVPVSFDPVTSTFTFMGSEAGVFKAIADVLVRAISDATQPDPAHMSA